MGRGKGKEEGDVPVPILRAAITKAGLQARLAGSAATGAIAGDAGTDRNADGGCQKEKGCLHAGQPLSGERKSNECRS